MTGKVDPSIVSIDHVGGTTNVHYLGGAVFVDGASSHLPKPMDGKVGLASDDYQAFVKNGYKPVVVSPGQMVQSTAGITTEVGPWINEAGCVSPPDNFDITKATDAQLALYGLPAVGKMPRVEYNKKFAWMKHRSCQNRSTNHPPAGALNSLQSLQAATQKAANHAMSGTMVPTPIWTGNVADQHYCGGGGSTGFGCAPGNSDYYTEADTDLFIPYLSNPSNVWPEATSSYWVGLGGVVNYQELNQTGIEGDINFGNIGYTPFVDWVGSQGTVNEQQVNLYVTGGSHIYERIQYPNQQELGNIDQQVFHSWAMGPAGSQATAEFIVEDTNQQGLANFGEVTFRGAGVTTQNGYFTPLDVQHDYTQTYWRGNVNGTLLSYDGGWIYDSGDYPYWDNQIYWNASCPGTCS